VTPGGSVGAVRRPRIASLWRQHRARWTLPLVIILIIGVVAVLDHIGSHRIAQVNRHRPTVLVATKGGSTTVVLDQPWNGFNPNTPWGAMSSTPTLLDSVLPSAYVTDPNLVPEVNANLLLGVETTSTTPLTIQYAINPRAVWSDGVPVTAADFVYAWESQRGDGVDIDGAPDQVASTLGYRDIASITSHDSGRTVVVTFARPFTDWRALFDHLVPAHVAEQVGWNAGFQGFDPARVLSAGPMELQSVSGGTAVLVRNRRWWGTPAVLSRITVVVSSSTSVWAAQLAASNHDVVVPSGFDLASMAAISGMPNTRSQVNPALGLLDLEFNTKSAITSRLALRQAIAHLVDRHALLDRTVGAVEPSLLVSEDHLAVPAQPGYTPSAGGAAYDQRDTTTADRLLRSAGFSENASGHYVDAAGAPLVLRLAVESGSATGSGASSGEGSQSGSASGSAAGSGAGDPWVATVASELVAQLRAEGLGVVVVPVEGTDGLRAAAAANAYDVALVARTAGPFQTQTATWFSSAPSLMAASDARDWSRFDDPAVDSLFAQAAQALNPVTGSGLYAQIDNQLWAQMVALPLFGEPGLLADGPLISNVVYNDSLDGIFWNASSWALLRPEPSSKSA